MITNVLEVTARERHEEAASWQRASTHKQERLDGRSTLVAKTMASVDRKAAVSVRVSEETKLLVQGLPQQNTLQTTAITTAQAAAITTSIEVVCEAISAGFVSHGVANTLQLTTHANAAAVAATAAAIAASEASAASLETVRVAAVTAAAAAAENLATGFELVRDEIAASQVLLQNEMTTHAAVQAQATAATTTAASAAAETAATNFGAVRGELAAGLESLGGAMHAQNTTLAQAIDSAAGEGASAAAELQATVAAIAVKVEVLGVNFQFMSLEMASQSALLASATAEAQADRQAAAEDRQAAAEDRQAASTERQAATAERVSAAEAREAEAGDLNLLRHLPAVLIQLSDMAGNLEGVLRYLQGGQGGGGGRAFDPQRSWSAASLDSMLLHVGNAEHPPASSMAHATPRTLLGAAEQVRATRSFPLVHGAFLSPGSNSAASQPILPSSPRSPERISRPASAKDSRSQVHDRSNFSRRDTQQDADNNNTRDLWDQQQPSPKHTQLSNPAVLAFNQWADVEDDKGGVHFADEMDLLNGQISMHHLSAGVCVQAETGMQCPSEDIQHHTPIRSHNPAQSVLPGIHTHPGSSPVPNLPRVHTSNLRERFPRFQVQTPEMLQFHKDEEERVRQDALANPPPWAAKFAASRNLSIADRVAAGSAAWLPNNIPNSIAQHSMGKGGVGVVAPASVPSSFLQEEGLLPTVQGQPQQQRDDDPQHSFAVVQRSARHAPQPPPPPPRPLSQLANQQASVEPSNDGGGRGTGQNPLPQAYNPIAPADGGPVPVTANISSGFGAGGPGAGGQGAGGSIATAYGTGAQHQPYGHNFPLPLGVSGPGAGSGTSNAPYSKGAGGGAGRGGVKLTDSQEKDKRLAAEKQVGKVRSCCKLV